jgi:hypothetical protein
MFFLDDDRDTKRSLGIRDRQILYRNAKGRCQNPACNKKIEFDEMQVGHKTAWSRRGSTTLRNSVCLCYRCNKLQGTDSWAVFLKKQGVKDPKEEVKQSLQNLTLQQLKLLAAKHKVKVTGRIEEDLFSSRRLAPTKRQYVNKLSGVVTAADLRSLPKELPKPPKKPTRRRSDDSWW